MLVVGLTGGIGSGKSTVSHMLAERGAVVIDADQIARSVVEPGNPAYAAVVARFGHSVVRADGGLDRQALADVVFADPEALDALNGIVHPAVRRVVADRLAAEASTDHVVVLEVPLWVETGGPYDVAGLIVVDCPEDLAVSRLVESRPMDEADVRRRLAAQATRAQRLAAADFVVANDGSWEHLEAEVERAWTWITTQLAPAADRTGVVEGRQDPHL